MPLRLASAAARLRRAFLSSSGLAIGARTIAIGALGGFLLSRADVPLAWMLGAMFATLASSLAGLRVRVSTRVRSPMALVLGVAIGASFTPAMLAGMAAWWASLLMIVPYVLIVAGLGAWYFHRVAGFDARTAVFAAIPGGLNEMILLGDAAGADVGRIATAQAARILLTVASLPPAFALFGLSGDPSLRIAAGVQALDGAVMIELAALLAGGVLAWRIAARLRVPVPMLMGPLAASAAAHAVGWATIRVPFELVAAAQVVIGCSAGARFRAERPIELLRVVLEAAGYVAVAIAVAVLFSLAIAAIGATDFASALLAFAPAGINEMSLFSLVLGLDAGFVATHQVARIACVLLVAPLLGRWLVRRMATR